MNQAGRNPLGEAVYFGQLSIIGCFIMEYDIEVNCELDRATVIIS